MTPILLRFEKSLNMGARHALRAYVRYHGAEVVTTALAAWEPGYGWVRDPLVLAMVNAGMSTLRLARFLGIEHRVVKAIAMGERYREPSTYKPRKREFFTTHGIAKALAETKARNAAALRGAA